MNPLVILRLAAIYKCHPQAASAAVGILECFAEGISSVSPREAVKDPSSLCFSG